MSSSASNNKKVSSKRLISIRYKALLLPDGSYTFENSIETKCVMSGVGKLSFIEESVLKRKVEGVSEKFKKKLNRGAGPTGGSSIIFRMLSAISQINLSSGQFTVNPLRLDELKINELSEEDMMRYFNDENEMNNYYCKAILKLSFSITATFESSHNYVNAMQITFNSF